jgi:hypothetical protein
MNIECLNLPLRPTNLQGYTGKQSGMVIGSNSNKIQFNSMQWHLLASRLNSTIANYKASTRTQIQHKTVQMHKNKTLNRQNKTSIAVSK